MYQPLTEAEGPAPGPGATQRLRPLRESYCAVYRPSLTDSKLRCGSFALYDSYDLVPPSRPKARPWVTGNGEELHLEHQVWQREQGHLCYAGRWAGATMSRIPRLGVQMTVCTLDCVEPQQFRWRGAVALRLTVATRETIGSATAPTLEALRRLWPATEEGSYDDDEFGFLAQTFGVRFYNLIRDDLEVEAKVTGPKSLEQLNVGSDTVTGSWQVSGLFYNPVDLHAFPFDTCSWDVIISIIGWSPGLAYDWSALHNFTEFEVLGLHGLPHPTKNRWYPYACEQNVVPNSARGGESFVNCRFYTRRRPGSTLNAIVFPMALATVLGNVGMAQASGWVRNELASTDPIALQGGLLLTVVAIKFSAMDSLPKGLGKATLLDKYALACIVLLTLSMFCLAYSTVEELDGAAAPYLYLALVALIHGLSGAAAWAAWRVPTAPAGERLLPAPHQPDEEVDEEYLHPGPRCRLQEVAMGFAT